MLKLLIITKYIWNAVLFTSVTLWYLANTTNLDVVVVQYGMCTNFNVHSGPVQSTEFTVLFRAQSINKIKNKKEAVNQVTLVIFIFHVSPADMELTQDMLMFSNLNINRQLFKSIFWCPHKRTPAVKNGNIFFRHCGFFIYIQNSWTMVLCTDYIFCVKDSLTSSIKVSRKHWP